MIDLDDHPFSPKNIALESGAPDKSERAWLRWVAQVEKLLGHNLDGNDVDGQGCGYSLDEGGSMFDGGATPEAYVADVRSRPRYRAPV